MTLDLLKVAEKGAALSASEHDANFSSIETEVNAKATTLAVDTALAGKVNTTDPSVTNQRVPLDGDYGLFTLLSGTATIVEATEAQMRDGTADKVPDAAVLKSMLGLATVASASGILTLNWATLTKLGVKVTVAEAITSVAISNLPDLPVSVLFESTGSFAVTLPAHNATVDGLTWKYLNNDVLPSLPSGNNTGFLLNMRKSGTRIYAQVSIWTA